MAPSSASTSAKSCATCSARGCRASTPSPDEKTPFSELAGTFTVTNGIAKNQDLRLVSTHLQLNGEGTLDLGPRQIDYTVRTKIGGGAPDPGATIKVGTLEVPVSIVGPWEKPAFGIKGQEQLTGHAEADRQEPQIPGRSGRDQRPAARRRREAREAARPASTSFLRKTDAPLPLLRSFSRAQRA